MPAIVLYNGPIYTLDPNQPRVQALAIRDGRIIAAGSEGKVQAAAGGRAEGINLRGRAAIPALTDAHVHLTWYALGRREVRLEDVDSIDAAVVQAATLAAELPPGAWLRGGGWDHTRWGGAWPTAADLDTLVPDRPVLLMRKDGHSAWANSCALKLAGITDSTPDPAGGAIKREKGVATGVLLENAIELVRQHMPAPTTEERLAALRDVMSEAHSYGMAGVHVPPSLQAGDAALSLSDLQQLRAAGDLKLRCLVHYGIDQLDETLALGLRSGLGDEWLRLGAMKMFADGSLGSETAEMLSHYEGRRHLGTATLDTETLNDAVRRSVRGGIAVIVHAIGDAANRRVLDAIEAALPEGAPITPNMIPNRIEHVQIIHPADLPRFAKLGVVASMQPIHATADIDVADRLWGHRCAHAYAWRALQEAGATLAFGSDAPVEPLNPWFGIHAAATRQRRDNTPPEGWYPDQRISVLDALRGFTYGAAVAAGAAHEQGTLAVGKRADIAVLSADPFKVPPAELHTIQSELTMIDGGVVWERTS